MTPAPAFGRRKVAALVLGVAAVLLALATVVLAASGPGSDPPVVAQHGSGHSGGSSGTSTPSGPPARVLTVEQLAASVGCQAKIDITGADYRQARCTAAGSPMVFVDFDTVEGQRSWLDYAVMYGGVYLVGNRWALSGNSKQHLETLRSTLGGTIEESPAHSGS